MNCWAFKKMESVLEGEAMEKSLLEKELSELMEFTLRMENEVYSMAQRRVA